MTIKYEEYSSGSPSKPSQGITPGDRVGALRQKKHGVIEFFGYGVYLGLEEDNALGAPNPKIKLDSGEIVWGYQCWWTTEERVKAMLHGHKVVIVPVPGE